MTECKKKKKASGILVTIHAHAPPFHVLTKCWHSSLYSRWSVQCVGSGHWLATAWAQEEVLWQLRWEIQMRSNGGQHNWFILRPSTIQLISDICYIYLLSTLRCGLLLCSCTHNGGFSFSSNLWNIFSTCVVVLRVTPGVGRLQSPGRWCATLCGEPGVRVLKL